MNKTELVDNISAHTEMTKVNAASALDAVLNGIATALKNGDDVRLAGFGTFSVKHRAETKGRNPSTGAEMVIPASKNAGFKIATALKAELNKK